MKIEIIHQELFLLYGRAKQNFKKCINDEDNKFLKDEVSIPLDNILLFEKEIKIVFTQLNFKQYYFQVSLILIEGNKEIGEYLYMENDKEEAIDDSLVFY